MGFAAWGRFGALALALGAAASCSKSHPSASANPVARPPQQTVAALPQPADGQHGAGKQGGGKFNESAVYLDGVPKGILRYSELPAQLKAYPMPEIDDLPVARYYRLADYLEAIGVDLAKVRELHIYGSHDRIAVVTPAEILAHRAGVVFDFTRQTGGKPRARWSQLHSLPHKPMVDVIMDIAIYEKKNPPTYAHGEILVDGKPTDEGIPYVGDEVPKGTRVYVDGKLDGWVRRKHLPSKLIAPGSSEAHATFSTDAFLAWVGADSHLAKTIDFFDGDTLVARVDGKTWAKTKNEYGFQLPQRSHGKVQGLFPGDKSARISSIALYVHTTPASREPDPAAFEPQEGGSEESQGNGAGTGSGDGNGGNIGVTPAAQGVNGGPSPADDDQF
jgi:hypothetical protein